jgi:hypothetical protein
MTGWRTLANGSDGPRGSSTARAVVKMERVANSDLSGILSIDIVGSDRLEFANVLNVGQHGLGEGTWA